MSIEDLINNIQTHDYANASPIVSSILADKMNSALDAERIKVASSMFGEEPDEDEDDDFDEDDIVDDDLDGEEWDDNYDEDEE
jgi:hypothetical protein